MSDINNITKKGKNKQKNKKTIRPYTLYNIFLYITSYCNANHRIKQNTSEIIRVAITNSIN